MRVASFFSGIGGVELGLLRAGHPRVYACEIDPFARAVYGARWGTEPEGSDVQQVRPHDVPDADLWAGGVPCQDNSTAGKRAGLHGGTRSGLLWTWLALAEARRPEWILYENVPGLLSVNKGADFADVLATVDRMGYDAAWRVLDARHFGVPQRRRRVFLLCRARGVQGARPWDVLDVPVGPKPRAPSGGSWKNAGGIASGYVWEGRIKDEWFPEALLPSSLRDVLEPDVDPRYDLSPKACEGILRRAERRGRALPPVLDGALRWVARNERPDPALGFPDPALGFPDPAGCVAASAGHHGRSSPRGDGQDNLVVHGAFESTSGTRETGWGPVSPPLRIGSGIGVPSVPSVVLGSFNSTGESGNGGNGWDERVAPPVKVGSGVGIASPPAVVVCHETGQGWWKEDDAAGSLRVEGENRPSRPSRGRSWVVRAGDYAGSVGTTRHDAVATGLRVRRLTPRECERLQGLPDDYTVIPWKKGAPAADSLRYKVIGNGVAVPVLEWIGWRLAAAVAGRRLDEGEASGVRSGWIRRGPPAPEPRVPPAAP